MGPSSFNPVIPALKRAIPATMQQLVGIALVLLVGTSAIDLRGGANSEFAHSASLARRSLPAGGLEASAVAVNESDGKALSGSPIPSNTPFQRFKQELTHELEMGDATEGNKIILALINGLALGLFGVDRCYAGQVLLGMIKGCTFGGFIIWAVIDFWVIFINCIAHWESMGALGFHMKFEKDHLQAAFWVALLLLVAKMVMSGGGAHFRFKGGA